MKLEKIINSIKKATCIGLNLMIGVNNIFLINKIYKSNHLSY